MHEPLRPAHRHEDAPAADATKTGSSANVPIPAAMPPATPLAAATALPAQNASPGLARAVPGPAKPVPSKRGRAAAATEASGKIGASNDILNNEIINLLNCALERDHKYTSDVLSWHAHIPFSSVLMRLLQPATVVELGVHKGDSLLAMAEACRLAGLTTQLYGIDTWQGDAHAGGYDGDAILAGLMQRASGFGTRLSLIRARFDAVLPQFPLGSVDLLHIDGWHSYAAVKADFDSWRDRLSPRGVVLFHDTAVRKADFGVWKLWQELTPLAPHYQFHFGNGLGVLALGPEVPQPLLDLLALLNRDKVLAGLFSAIGEAFESHSLRSRLNIVEATHQLAITDLHQRVQDERQRLEALLSRERRSSDAEYARLAAQTQQDRQQAETEFARLRGEAEHRVLAERQEASGHILRLEREQQALQLAAEQQRQQLMAERDAAVQTQVGQQLAQMAAVFTQQLADGAAERAALQQAAAAALAQATAAGAAQQAADLAHTAYNAQQDATIAQAARHAMMQFEANQQLAQRLADVSQQLDDRVAERAGLDREAETALAEATEALHAQQEAAAAEAARLQALIDHDRSAGGAEILRLNQEIAQLGREHQAQLHAARLRARLARRIKHLGQPLFHALPLPGRSKMRLRLAILNRFGPALELLPPRPGISPSALSLTLPAAAQRRLDLARAATGLPQNLPPRSVSVIIPVHNQIDYTLRCLETLFAQQGQIALQVIVVDDASTDETELRLYPRQDITYLRLAKNQGFIGACNAGLAAAKHCYVCYLNNDTEVTPGWMEALLDSFELHPGLGMVGAQLLYPDGRLQEAGGIIWSDYSGWNYGRLQAADDPRHIYARQVDYASGAALLLPRTLAEAMGGFDASFAPAYGEDSDLAFRLRGMGLATLYQPQSRVIHHEGISAGTDESQGMKAYQRINAEKLARRWAHRLAAQGENGRDLPQALLRGRLGRILVVDQITPEPDRDAGSITALEIMRALRDLGYQLSFVPCSNFTYIPEYSDLLASMGIQSLLYPWVKSLEEHLAEAGDSYAAVLVFRVNTAAEVLPLLGRHAPQAKLIFHNSDLHFLREERAAALEDTGLATQHLRPDSTKRVELSIIARADATLLHSHFEKELLTELVPQAQVTVLPWIYAPRGPGPDFAARQDLLFLGGYRHYPNVDAVLHYAQDIAPLLAALLPEARFCAVGSQPPPELAALAGPGLQVEGFVEDLGTRLQAARLMLVPLRYGAGLKGKIISAMAHGLPVVTTSMGAEGMGLQHEQDVLIADTPRQIAEAVTRLYRDEALWNRLRANGLAFVARTTSPQAGRQILRQLLTQIGLPHLPEGASPVAEAGLGTPAQLYDLAALRAALAPLLAIAPDQLPLYLPGDLGDLRGCRSGQLSGNAMAADGLAQMPQATAEPSTARDRPSHIGAPADAPLQIAQYRRGQPAVLLLDAFDDRAVEAALIRAKAAGMCQMGGWLLFLPPRLRADAAGYQLQHALSGQPVAAAAAAMPVHLRHAAVLQRLGLEVTWQAETRLLAYPSLSLAKFTSRGDGR